MLNWDGIVQDYIVKYSNEIKKTTKPLKDLFGISYFTYHKIEDSGKYTVLVDRPDFAEHYVSEKIFLKDPYLRHPKVYESGVCLMESYGSEEYKKIILKSGKTILNMNTAIILIQKQANFVEFFGFTGNSKNSSLQSLYLNHPQVLVRNYPSFIKRIQLYASHSYVSQISSGEQYNILKPVILLCIANRVLFPSKNNCISYHDTLDRHTEEHDLEDISYVFIELPKFNKQEQDLITLQDQWFYFFKNWENIGEIPSTIQEKEIIDAYHAMEQFNWSKEELGAYFEAQIALADDFLARQAERDEGKAEGINIGIDIGKAEAVLEMAKKMLKRGISLADIIEDTGLSLQEITRLQGNYR